MGCVIKSLKIFIDLLLKSIIWKLVNCWWKKNLKKEVENVNWLIKDVYECNENWNFGKKIYGFIMF